MKKFNIAVVGATGNVGREMLNVLEERQVSVDQLFPVASARSAGKKLPFNGKEWTAENVEAFDFSQCDIALFSAGGEISKAYAPKAAAAGCVVVDNSSAWRMDPDVPLVVPEVNAEALASYTTKNIIANPNCSTIQMVVALQPLHEAFGLKQVAVATYQAVSGAGKAAMEELATQNAAVAKGEEAKVEKFTKQISGNCIPHIDVFMEDGRTKEEWKMAVETDKIMGGTFNVNATCVRVPAMNSHAEAIHAAFDNPVTAEAAREILQKAPGVVVEDERQNGGYATQIEADGRDEVFVSRLRADPTIENGLCFWCVADNLRKGAATNTVQIAKVLMETYLS